MKFPKPKRVKDKKALEKFRSQPCIICGDLSDPCHIQSQGAGGDDLPDNLLSLCRKHHTEMHMKGWPHMFRFYRAVGDALFDKGFKLHHGGGRTTLIKR